MPTEPTSLRGIQCPGRLLSLAGFQVIISGRFWVIAEDLVRIYGDAREGFHFYLCLLSFALSHFRMVAHFLRGQSHYFAVTPNVEWQPQTGVFVDDLRNCLLECHLSTLLEGQSTNLLEVLFILHRSAPSAPYSFQHLLYEGCALAQMRYRGR